MRNVASIVFTLLLTFYCGKAQDLDNISKKDILGVSGGISAQTTLYTAIGIPANRAPFLGQINLNLNFDILGIISAPFSATFSSQAFQLNQPQPFNNFGISPHYKSITLHLGYRSMNLSEFSLSGSQFLGVGVEVSPEDSWIKGKAMFGRFARPVFFNPDGSVATDPSFSRLGWGTGITLGKSEKSQLSLNLFKAKDDPNSLSVPAEDLGITPADNLVIGIQGKKEITKAISLDGEVDLSFFTNNTNVPREVLGGYSYFNNLPFFHQNATSQLRKAIIANLNYKPGFAKFQVGYRRVDASYRTLGTAFINNDYEDIKLKTSFALVEKRLSVNLSGGVQRNNLENKKVTKMLRLISAVGLNYNINEKWSAGANFANFSTDTRQTIVLTLDSLSMIQTTKSMSGNLSRSSSNESHSNSLNLSLNYQDAIVDQVRTTTFYNLNLGWQQQFLQSKTSFGASLMGMHTISESSANTNLGPSVMTGRPVAKGKVQLNFSAAYLLSFTNGVSSGGIANATLNGNLSLGNKQKIGFNIGSIVKNVNQVRSTEITSNANYSYSF